MATQRYTVTPHPIETLLTWVKSGRSQYQKFSDPLYGTLSKFETCSTRSITVARSAT